MGTNTDIHDRAGGHCIWFGIWQLPGAYKSRLTFTSANQASAANNHLSMLTAWVLLVDCEISARSDEGNSQITIKDIP